MRNLSIVAALASALLFSACDKSEATGGDSSTTGQEQGENSGTAPAQGAAAGVATTVSKIQDLLKGVTNTETAESAKSQLGTLIERLKSGMGNLPRAGGGLGGALGETIEGAMNSALPESLKAPLAAVREQIGRLMGNADVTAVLGPMLERLQQLLPGA